MREKAASVLGEQAHPGIVHPVGDGLPIAFRLFRIRAAEVLAHDVEDRRLDLDAIEALDRVEEEATRRLPGPDPHDENPAGVRVEEHRQVRGQALVLRGPLALPPAIDLQAERPLVSHHRDVPDPSLADGDELVAGIEQVVVGKRRPEQPRHESPESERDAAGGDPGPGGAADIEETPGSDSARDRHSGEKCQRVLQPQAREQPEAGAQRSRDRTQCVERRQHPDVATRLACTHGAKSNGQREARSRQDRRRHQQQTGGEAREPDRPREEIRRRQPPQPGDRQMQRDQNHQSVAHLERTEVQSWVPRAIRQPGSEQAAPHDPEQHGRQGQGVGVNAVGDEQRQEADPEHLPADGNEAGREDEQGEEGGLSPGKGRRAHAWGATGLQDSTHRRADRRSGRRCTLAQRAEDREHGRARQQAESRPQLDATREADCR